MKDLTDLALETAQLRGAGYADIRIVRRRRESVRVKNGKPDGAAQDESYYHFAMEIAH